MGAGSRTMDDSAWGYGDWIGVPDRDLVHDTTKQPWAAYGAFAPSKLRRVLLIDDLDDWRTYAEVCPRTTKTYRPLIEHLAHEHRHGIVRPEGIDVVETCLIDLSGQVSWGWPVEKDRLLASAEWSCREPLETGLLGDLADKGWAA